MKYCADWLSSLALRQRLEGIHETDMIAHTDLSYQNILFQEGNCQALHIVGWGRGKQLDIEGTQSAADLDNAWVCDVMGGSSEEVMKKTEERPAKRVKFV